MSSRVLKNVYYQVIHGSSEVYDREVNLWLLPIIRQAELDQSSNIIIVVKFNNQHNNVQHSLFYYSNLDKKPFLRQRFKFWIVKFLITSSQLVCLAISQRSNQ